MTAKVLQELDQLRSMLGPDVTTSYTPAGTNPYRPPARPYTAGSTSTSAKKSVDRLGRAIEAAEEEMEAALRRTTDIHKTQLRQKEIEVAELQRLLAAKEVAADSLRQSLSSSKRSYEHKLAHLESLLQTRDAELSTLHAELLALRAERDELTQRCQQGLAGISRVEDDLRERTAQLSSSLRAASDEATSAAAALTRERKEKELLMLEVVELQRELEGLEGDLATAQADASHASNRAQAEYDGRRELQVELDKAAAAAEVLRQTKDLEIAELRRRLKAEHGVRRACERWLKTELKSRGELEGLLLAVRDVALKGPAATSPSSPPRPSAAAAAAAADEEEVGQVEALLAKLEASAQQHHQQHHHHHQQQRQQKADGQGGSSSSSRKNSRGAAGQLLGGEAASAAHRQELAKLKAALGDDNRQLKAELESARQFLKAAKRSQKQRQL